MANGNPNRGPLSSRDPSTRSIAVRLPADLVSAIDAACEAQQISASELLRGLVAQWAYGDVRLAGPDEGYAQARSMAAQIAHAAIRKALGELPETHEDAKTMLEGYYGELAGARKRT